MRQILEIDENKVVITNLSLSELETLFPIVRASIKKKKADEKKKSKTGLLLFADPADEETIFSKSAVASITLFKKQLKEAVQLGVDVDYYYNSVLDWSETKKKEKRTARGWIATARGFMRRDNDNNRLKMIVTFENQQQSRNEMIEYLKS